MRALFVLLVTVVTAMISIAGDLTPKDLVAQLYQAHRSKHDPLDETALLGSYFDPVLLKLYLKDKREAKGEVGRLDGDPLYNAQDMEIKDFTISPPETAKGKTQVTVRFKNFGKATRVVYVLIHAGDAGELATFATTTARRSKRYLKANFDLVARQT